MKTSEKNSLNILICPNSFKGSLSAIEVAQAISQGIQASKLNSKTYTLDLLPIADGGDGSLAILNMALPDSQYKNFEVRDEHGQRYFANYLLRANEAIIELASICGIARLRGNLNPLGTSTYALGLAIIDACQQLKQYSKHYNGTEVKPLITITLGGSASTDGGAGSLFALGVRFFDHKEKPITPNGGNLKNIASIDFSSMIEDIASFQFQIATDVANPLYGINGAAKVYAKQKGANDQQINILDSGLKHYAQILEKSKHADEARVLLDTTKLSEYSGMGAAGGAAFGLAIGCRAKLISGIEWISQITKLEEKIKVSNLVITAEGRLDNQSLQGKYLGKISQVCAKYRKRLWVLPANIDAAEQINWAENGISSVFPLSANNSYCDSSAIVNAVKDIVDKNIAQINPQC